MLLPGTRIWPVGDAYRRLLREEDKLDTFESWDLEQYEKNELEKVNDGVHDAESAALDKMVEQLTSDDRLLELGSCLGHHSVDEVKFRKNIEDYKKDPTDRIKLHRLLRDVLEP